MICVCCGQQPSCESAGLEFRPVAFALGAKSGRPIPNYDFFADGTDSKFVCWDCLVNMASTEDVLNVLGLSGGNHDVDLQCLQETVPG